MMISFLGDLVPNRDTQSSTLPYLGIFRVVKILDLPFFLTEGNESGTSWKRGQNKKQKTLTTGSFSEVCKSFRPSLTLYKRNVVLVYARVHIMHCTHQTYLLSSIRTVYTGIYIRSFPRRELRALPNIIQIQKLL